MKKIYQTPAIRVRNLKPSNIVCASFGSGDTDTMHAKEGSFDIGTITPTTDATVTFDE